jgi:hypothetical protein
MTPPSLESSTAGLGETPPQFLGTSFGYHFASRGGVGTGSFRGASTLPRERRPRDDLASAIWSRWRYSTEPSEGATSAGNEHDGPRPGGMGRSRSEVSAPEQGEGLWRDTVSEGEDATGESRGSWGRNRGYSVV